MGVWDSYQSRLDARGSTKREVTLNRERDYLLRKMSNNLSYHSVGINGTQQDLAITNSDDLHQKIIYSLPGENILAGSIVFWCDEFWLVTSVDVNSEVYTKAIMQQCNHLLKWIAEDGSIIERWCIVSDGTKYLTGETMSSYNEIYLAFRKPVYNFFLLGGSFKSVKRRNAKSEIFKSFSSCSIMLFA